MDEEPAVTEAVKKDIEELASGINVEAINKLLEQINKHMKAVDNVNKARIEIVKIVNGLSKNSISMTVDSKVYTFNHAETDGWNMYIAQALLPVFDKWFEKLRKELDEMVAKLSEM